MQNKNVNHSCGAIHSKASERNPTKQLADIMIIDISLRQQERGGKNVLNNFSVVKPATKSDCKDVQESTSCGWTLRDHEGK